MGKWKVDVLVALKYPSFEIMLNTAHIARVSLDHFVHFLCKKRGPHTPLGLARLVHYKAVS